MEQPTVPAITLLIRHPLTAPPVQTVSKFRVAAALVDNIALIAAALRERIARHELN